MKMKYTYFTLLLPLTILLTACTSVDTVEGDLIVHAPVRIAEGVVVSALTSGDSWLNTDPISPDEDEMIILSNEETGAAVEGSEDASDQ